MSGSSEVGVIHAPRSTGLRSPVTAREIHACTSEEPRRARKIVVGRKVGSVAQVSGRVPPSFTAVAAQLLVKGRRIDLAARENGSCDGHPCGDSSRVRRSAAGAIVLR